MGLQVFGRRNDRRARAPGPALALAAALQCACAAGDGARFEAGRAPAPIGVEHRSTTAAAAAPGATMSDRPARSLFLWSTWVVELTVVEAEHGAWVDAGAMLFRRKSKLKTKVRDVFRGPVAKPPADVLAFEVEQYENRSPFGADLPGAWSAAALEPGAEVVVFAGAGALPGVLESPELVAGVAVARADVRLARDAEVEALPLDVVVGRASLAPGAVWIVLAEYLWERNGPRALEDREAASLLLGLLEAPGLTPPVRNVMVGAAHRLAMSAPVDTGAAYVLLLARTLFRLLALPEAALMRDNVVDPYLPALLGLTSGMPERCAHDVFEGRADEQRVAESTLRAYRGPADAPRLIAWIGRTGCR